MLKPKTRFRSWRRNLRSLDTLTGNRHTAFASFFAQVQPAGQNALLESLTWSDSPDESSCQISVQDCRGPPENGAGPMLVGGGAVFRSYETPAPSADQLAVTQGASEEATNGEMQSVTEADATAALAAGGTGMAAAQTVCAPFQI